jgi:lambda family phage portal protein
VITLQLPNRRAPRPTPKPKRRKASAVYAGAGNNRYTSDWISVLLSADRETRSSLRTLRGRSRQFSRDNAHVAGLIRSFADNIIGPDGIGVAPKMRGLDGQLLKPFNDAAFLGFQRWAEADTCSADGQNCWSEFQRLALSTWFTDGECFVQRLAGFDNDWGYSLRIIDADLLDESYNVDAAPGQRQITQGIEIDAFGRPVVYWFWDGHPSEKMGRKRVPIAASEIVHLFVQLRAGQRRGVPMLTPVLIALNLLDGYTEAEIMAARLAAAQSGYFQVTGENIDKAASADGEDDEDDPSLPMEIEVEAGVHRKIPDGWEFKPVSPDHPNGNFVEFQMAMLRMVSCGVGVSAITASHDLSDTSYSSGRIGLQAERDAFKAVQNWFGRRLVTPVYRDVLRYGSYAGLIRLPTPEPTKWQDVTLEPRGWPWIDPKNDADTTNKRLAGLITSPQRVCAAEGVDVEDVLDDWEEFGKMLAARGLSAPNYVGGSPPSHEASAEPAPGRQKSAAARLALLNTQEATA